MPSSPARFPTGVTNVTSRDTLGSLTFPDPTKVHVWFDDFDKYTAADWTITTTEAGSGSASESALGTKGGILLILNDDADNDADFLQWTTESWRFTSGKKLWFKACFQVADATQSDIVLGLQITDTTPLAVSDGVYFQSDDGDANLDVHVTKDSTSTSATAVATLADATTTAVGFYYNGDDEIAYFVDNVQKGTLATTNLPDDEDLTISFGIQNGEAAAKSLTLDYIFVAEER